MSMSDMTTVTKDTGAGRKARPGRAPQDRRKPRGVARVDEAAAIAEMVRSARAEGEDLVGPGGLLKRITKMVLETALEEEMTEHLGHGRHQLPHGPQRPGDGAQAAGGAAGAGQGGEGLDGPRNVRNGTRPKTVMTDAVGKMTIEVPRDRAGTFEPVIVPKHHRKLGSLDAVVLSLTAKGLTGGEISAHLEEIYGASVSKDTISRITDRVVEEMNEWMSRPLDPVYAAIFVDAIVVKVRDGQVSNRPF